MAYIYPPKLKNDRGYFGPTQNGHEYFAHPKHNRNAKQNGKNSVWILYENQQYEVFRLSDDNNWLCNDYNALFSIIEDGDEILGKNNERLAFFRIPVNSIDPYHGFPVSSEDYLPSLGLLDQWENTNIISNLTRMRIERGAI